MQPDEVKVGGEDRPREIFPVTDDDGRPVLYRVKIKAYRQKPGKPNDAGEETFFFSWSYEIAEGEHKGKTVYGSTNSEARRAYTTKKPLKLLQLIMALNGGKEPEKGSVLSLSSFIGKTLLVELENKEGADGQNFQQVLRYYPDKKAGIALEPVAPNSAASVDETPVSTDEDQEPKDGIDIDDI